MALIRLIVLVVVTILSGASPAFSQSVPRLALVIGNSSYENFADLRNPRNDAVEMAIALETLGFETMRLLDGSRLEIVDALLQFEAAADGAAQAIIYFSGLSLNVSGTDYLVPADALPGRTTGAELIDLNLALQAVGGASELGMVILEACHESFSDPGLALELRDREPPPRALLATACAPGTRPYRGTMTTGPVFGLSDFTAALLTHLRTPGLQLPALLFRVIDDVRLATRGLQTPAFYADPAVFAEPVYLVPPLPQPEIAVAAGELLIDDDTITLLPGTDFGTVAVGESGVVRTFAVRNDGAATLILGPAVLPPGFSLVEPLARSLAPGAFDTFAVRLDTTTAGGKIGEITFTTNDANENPFNFTIGGVVGTLAAQPRPEIAVAGGGQTILDGADAALAGTGTDFGTAIPGASVIRTFIVQNEGTEILTLGAVNVPDGFTLIEPLANALLPGAADTFQVRLDTSYGRRVGGQIRFATNDADENPFTFEIAGEVLPVVAGPAPPAPVGAGAGNADHADRLVEILEPAFRGTMVLERPAVEIVGRLHLEEVGDLLLFYVNEKRVEVAANQFRVNLDLRPGPNRVSFTVVTSDLMNRVEYIDIIVDEEFAAALGGTRYALLIGNQDYQSRLFTQLVTPIGDIEAIGDVLRDQFGFVTELTLGGGERFDLVLRNATSANIEDALSRLAQSLTADDALLIFYAGHGYWSPDNERAAWIPVDANPGNVFSYFSADDLQFAMRLIPARQILVVSDSCYAGALMREAAELAPVPDLNRDAFLLAAWNGKARVFIAAGGDEPVPDGGGNGHSVFAQAFLNALATAREMFSAQEVFVNYVLPQVAGAAGLDPRYQPMAAAGHERGDFVFFRQ